MNNQQYPLPEGWEWKPLSSLATIVSGGTPSREVPDFWEPPLHAWVTPTDITGKSGRFLFDAKERISDIGLSNSSATMLPIGTILMTSRATLGEAKIARIPCCTNQGFKSLVPKSDVPSEYLYYLLQLFKEKYQKLGIGSTFLEVNKKDTEKFLLPVAPPRLRPKIANILCELDDYIDSTVELIGKYEVTKQGLMADLFSRGIDPATGQLRPSVQDAPELYHETPLGFLPKGWEALTMQSVADDSRGSTVIGPFGSDLVASDYRPEGVPVVFVRDVKESSFRWVSDTFISNEKAQQLSAHSVTKGDVVVTKMGLPPCIAATYPDDMLCGVITADIIRIRPNADKVLSEWLSLVINSNEVKKQVEKITAGVTRPKVTLKDFRQLQGRFPTRTEQHEILKRLTPINSSIKMGELTLAKLQRQKAGLMRDLLTGKVPVSA